MINRHENNTNVILNSLDGIQRAKAKPFMFTRVMRRLQNEEKSIWSQIASIITRPAIALACMAAVISINVYFAVTTDNESDTSTPTSTTLPTVDEYWQNENFVMAVNNSANNE